VVNARKLGKSVKIRHNLTVIFDGNPQTGETKEYLPEFFAENQVEIIASLPHFTKAIVDANRGTGVFDKSIEGIRKLNTLGYGKPGTDLILNLVYNCDGPVFPDEKQNLELAFRTALRSNYGLVFNGFLCVTNVPVNRFYSRLLQSNSYDEYMRKLVFAFNPDSVGNLVCRSLISVDYRGNIYDCDFNQMLNLQVCDPEPANLVNFDLNKLLNRQIQFGPHCFGCTAGGGSS
jgi:radical SAM/Cys-rich protein